MQILQIIQLIDIEWPDTKNIAAFKRRPLWPLSSTNVLLIHPDKLVNSRISLGRVRIYTSTTFFYRSEAIFDFIKKIKE